MDTFTDPRDGNVYKIIKIGNQTIMAENLRFRMPYGCWAYKNNEDYLQIYGYLYDWNTAKKVATKGWHLPTQDEWKAIYKILGDDGEIVFEQMKIGGNTGFNVCFAGWRSGNGEFDGKDKKAVFWSSTYDIQGVGERAHVIRFTNNYNYVDLSSEWCSCSFSVRLFKD